MPTLSGSRPDAPAGTRVRFISELPLRSRRFAMAFLRDAMRIDRLLRGLLGDETSGLVSYELHAHPLRNQYRTVSTWTSDDALHRFAAHPLHVEIMRRQRDRLGDATFETTHTDTNGFDTTQR